VPGVLVVSGVLIVSGGCGHAPVGGGMVPNPGLPMGLGAGEHGGRVVFSGTLEALTQEPRSLTAKYWRGELSIPVPATRRKGIPQRIKLIGARDPNGIRPLILGELNGAYILCSETCALDIIGAKYIREIENGEVVVIWITAAEMRPMTSAWPMLGRTTRMVRQKAEMMNSELIMPPEMPEMALPTVKLRMMAMRPQIASHAARRPAHPCVVRACR